MVVLFVFSFLVLQLPWFTNDAAYCKKKQRNFGYAVTVSSRIIFYLQRNWHIHLEVLIHTLFCNFVMCDFVMVYIFHQSSVQF